MSAGNVNGRIVSTAKLNRSVTRTTVINGPIEEKFFALLDEYFSQPAGVGATNALCPISEEKVNGRIVSTAKVNGRTLSTVKVNGPVTSTTVMDGPI